MNKAAPVLAAHQLSKIYGNGDFSVPVLNQVSFEIAPGEQIAIVGQSGSGKSTLLHLLGGLDAPSNGQVFLEGQDFAGLSQAAGASLRNRALGFVYQFHHLLPEFTALENVAMPLLIGRSGLGEARERAAIALNSVGLGHRLRHKPGELSGGERQRAAIARALVTRPRCVLADEPTGNLDEKTAISVCAELLRLNRELNTALLIVTHDDRLARRMDKVLQLSGGRLI